MANISISEIQKDADTLENEDLILVSQNNGNGSFTSAKMKGSVLKSQMSGGDVTGPSSSVNSRVATFSGTTGKVIQDSGFTIAKSVPADAKFTDTTYNTATTSANGLMSSSDKTKLNGVSSGAEVNQNTFSNVKVGDTTISSNAKTDTLTLAAGANVTLTPDASNKKVVITAAGGGSGCTFSSEAVETACTTALESKSVSTLKSSEVQAMLDNMSAKPVFYDTDNAVVIKPSDGESSTTLTYTATKNGCAFCSYTLKSSPSSSTINNYVITLNDYRVATIGYNGLRSDSGSGYRNINDNFKINMKSGQTIKLTCNTGSTGQDIQITFLPFL